MLACFLALLPFPSLPALLHHITSHRITHIASHTSRHSSASAFDSAILPEARNTSACPSAVHIFSHYSVYNWNRLKMTLRAPSSSSYYLYTPYCTGRHPYHGKRSHPITTNPIQRPTNQTRREGVQDVCLLFYQVLRRINQSINHTIAWTCSSDVTLFHLPLPLPLPLPLRWPSISHYYHRHFNIRIHCPPVL